MCDGRGAAVAVQSCFVHGQSDPRSCGDSLFGGCLVLLVVGWWRVDSGFLGQETKLARSRTLMAIRDRRSAVRIRVTKMGFITDLSSSSLGMTFVRWRSSTKDCSTKLVVHTVTPGSDGSPAATQDHPRGRTGPGSDGVARMPATADASEPLNREHKDARHKVEPEKDSTEVKISSGGQATNIRATFRL